MSYETLTVRIRGLAPLIVHNGELVDPMNPLVKEIKKITAKGKKKTDADLEELARLEWTAGLYLDEAGRPVVPGENIEAMLVAAAKKSRKGKDATAGMISDGLWPIEYDGPKTIDELWAHRGFRKSCGARVGQAKVFRCRPMFRKWELKFEVAYMPDVINRSDIIEWLNTAGRLVGLCDWRPKFGRFEVVDVN